MLCHGCQHEISIPSGESIGFREACDGCQMDLHVCLNCAHYDASAYNECRESSAERILDKDRANRCDYFRPAEAGQQASHTGRDAMTELENLFKKG